ncbi:hypothetical protein CVO76_07850, partial [Arthrobacter agilis]
MNEQPGFQGDAERPLPPQPQNPPSWGTGRDNRQSADQRDGRPADQDGRQSDRQHHGSAQDPSVSHPAYAGHQPFYGEQGG